MNYLFFSLLLCSRVLLAASVGESVNYSLYALQQMESLIPESLWLQEFSILIDRKAFRKQIKMLMNCKGRETFARSGFALASSRDYLLRSTMSGQNIRMMDRYGEFEESPFWRTPEMLKTLYWLEERE